MSFQIAISGLNAARTDLTVTSENIANSSTIGFKSGRAEFADFVTSADNSRATKSGSGVQVRTVAQSFQQGTLTSTGNPLDLAVGGNGFFRLRDSEQGAAVYARAGQFSLDKDGLIVNSSGQTLTGFAPGSEGAITGKIIDMRIKTGEIPPKATSTISIAANINAESPIVTNAFDVNDEKSFNSSTVLDVFDSLGTKHTAVQYFRKTATNTWETYLSVDDTQVGGADTLNFSNTGALSSPVSGAINKGPYAPAGADPITFKIDLADLTQFDGGFGVTALSQDGFASGELTDVSIDDNGTLFSRYSNGESLAQGQVALASFTNPQGLKRIGESSWEETSDSGSPIIGAAGTGNLGAIESGAIEESNVELSQELVKLITAQRMFQANAQAITANDTLTQTLLNIG